MSLDDLRHRIDTIDDQILALLEQRAEVAASIASEKRNSSLPIVDPERERQVLARLSARGTGHFPRASIAAVYREVISACVAIQEPTSIAFLGPEGTFTHIAARKLFGLAARYHEAASIDGVFDAVRRGITSYGVVPVENSTEGSVTHAVDALLEGGVLIRGEMFLEVSHCLLSRASRITEVERVYSHPQALLQCREWIAKNLASAQLVQTPSTASAARDALSDPKGAAIGSSLAGELYGLCVLRGRIQDRTDNATRFMMLAKEDAPRTGCDKTTLSFALRDACGALRRVLEVFDAAGVNLSRIESRPSREKAWDYVFLVDVEGHRTDETVSAAIAGLHTICASITLLGSYPRDLSAVGEQDDHCGISGD
jgi:chorismate mutase/prephenate dehydratase